MADARLIRLNQLLLEREAQFVRVHSLEQAAAKILGEPYPFTRPALPSDVRRKAKPAPRGATAGLREQLQLRRLEETETAYRVTYRQAERVVTEEHDAFEAVRTLLSSQTARLEVQKIETLDTTGAVKAVLFARDGTE